ncbi:MAG: SapC family protein [Woeseiaceae bacterium]
MPNYALVNKDFHQETRIKTERSAELGDGVQMAITFPAEFRNVQSDYPILFQKSGDDDYIPVALFGFEPNENLFLNDDGWNASYIPAMVRKEPFLIGSQGDGDDANRLLSLDLDHPRVNQEEGEALFGELGEMTDFLESRAAMLEMIYAGTQENKRLVQALVDQDLIESVTFDITLNDGTRNSLLGFHTINEEKLADLSAETLHLFNRNDMLVSLFMIIASTNKMQGLIDRKNARLNI